MAQVIFQRKVKTYQCRKAPSSNDFEYHTLYRFTENNVSWLADHFLDTKTETRGGALTSKQRMEITLRYLANPGFQTGIAKEMGVHRSTISKTIMSTLKKISEKGDQWIVFPHTKEEINRAKIAWANKKGFPCTIGAIDCTHVKVHLRNAEFRDEFINRKGYTSINVQVSFHKMINTIF